MKDIVAVTVSNYKSTLSAISMFDLTILFSDAKFEIASIPENSAPSLVSSLLRELADKVEQHGK